MAALSLPNAKAKRPRGIVVQRPRASDAIGSALHRAFDPDGGVPADMVRLLRKLDGKRG